MMVEEARVPLVIKARHYVEVWRKENVFIKNCISRNIGTTCGKIKAFKTFMDIVIAQEDTLFGLKLKLA
jgi:hypothetical protein